MSPNPNLLSIIFLLGAAQGFFLIFLLCKKKVNRQANRILALLIFTFSYPIAAFAFWYNDYLFVFLLTKLYHFYATIDPFPLLFGPLFFLYARVLASNSGILRKRDLLHFLPAVAFTIFLLPDFLESAEFKIARLIALRTETADVGLTALPVLLYNVSYLAWTTHILSGHQKNIKDIFSSIEKVNLRWLRQLTIIFAAVWGAFIVLMVAEWIGYRLIYTIEPGLLIVMAIVVYIIGYYGQSQPKIFEESEPENMEQRKYSHSGLDREKTQQYMKKLTKAMEKDYLYQNGGLTLSELSKELAISPNHLSQVINAGLQKNFYDFVNEYRIEAARKMLHTDESNKLTILAIAYEVGFNSKSAFNTAFKTYTNMTPSAYRNLAAKAA